MKTLDKKTCNYGYTLIELLVVLALFAIVLSIGIPSINIIFNTSEKNELVRFKRDIVYARNSAIIENTVYMLYVDKDNNGYKITKVGKTPTLVRDVQFCNGIIIKGNNFNSEVNLYQTGTTSKIGTIELTNRKKQKIEITITIATGKINLYIDR